MLNQAFLSALFVTQQTIGMEIAVLGVAFRDRIRKEEISSIPKITYMAKRISS